MNVTKGILLITAPKTVVAGAIAYWLLPTSITTASYLSEEERAFAVQRLQGRADTDRFKYVSASTQVTLPFTDV